MNYMFSSIQWALIYLYLLCVKTCSKQQLCKENKFNSTEKARFCLAKENSGLIFPKAVHFLPGTEERTCFVIFLIH